MDEEEEVEGGFIMSDDDLDLDDDLGPIAEVEEAESEDPDDRFH